MAVGVLLWILGLALSLVASLGLLFVVLVQVVGREQSHAVLPGPGGVEVHHIVVEKVGLSANTCQYIDLRRGIGLFRRHNIATYCAEADGAEWTVEVTDSEVRIGGRGWPRCRFGVDATRLRLVNETGSEDCGWLLE